MNQIFQQTHIHARTLSVSVSVIDALVEESVIGDVSCRQPQEPDHQKVAQKRKHGAEMVLFLGTRLIRINYKIKEQTN